MTVITGIARAPAFVQAAATFKNEREQWLGAQVVVHARSTSFRGVIEQIELGELRVKLADGVLAKIPLGAIFSVDRVDGRETPTPVEWGPRQGDINALRGRDLMVLER